MKTRFNVLSVIFFIAILVTFNSKQTVTAQTEVKKQLVPTVTIPAPPGSKGFGMPQIPKPGTTPTSSAPIRRGGSASLTEPREIRTLPIDSMSMSDPYILADDATKTYYLTGSGGGIYKSKDLKTWTGPYGAYDVTGTWMEGINFVAAAEIHHVNNGPRKPRYYEIDDSGDKLVLGKRFIP